MASNRLAGPGEKGKGRERVGLVKDPYAAFKSGASDDEDGSDDDDEEEEEKEAELMVAGRKRALSVSPQPEPAAAPKEESRRGKGKGREVPNDRARPRPDPPVKGKARPAESAHAPKSTIDEPPAVEPKRSMRDMKKEAFSKRYPMNSSGRSVGSLDGRKGRGQPNMGARMGVLLEQIKRTK